MPREVYRTIPLNLLTLADHLMFNIKFEFNVEIHIVASGAMGIGNRV